MTTSPQNIMPGSTPSSDKSVLESKDKVEPVESAAAALEYQIEHLRTERKQERFFWLLAVTALLNVGVASIGVANEVVFLLFSLIFLIGAAKWLEVPWIVYHLEKWLYQRLGGKSGDSGTE